MANTVVNDGPRQTAKLISETDGVQITKGGQKFDTGFGEAVFASYSNLSNSPLCFFLFGMSLVCVIPYTFDLPGPLETLEQMFRTVAEETDRAKMVKLIAGGLVKFLDLCIRFKFMFICYTMLAVVYLRKPSTKNFGFSVFLAVIVLLFHTKLMVLEMFLGLQLWFLFTEIRSPKFRFIMVTVVIILFCTFYMIDPHSTNQKLAQRSAYVFLEPETAKQQSSYSRIDPLQGFRSGGRLPAYKPSEPSDVSPTPATDQSTG